MSMQLEFIEAIGGTDRIINYNRAVLCQACEGNKVIPANDQKACTRCAGDGNCTRNFGDICPACSGTGLESVVCTQCRGDGLRDDSVSLAVKIPKSVDHGMLLRIRDKGHQALNGAFGDLILHMAVMPHPRFRREGYDIHSTKSLTVTQAIFGGECEIETIKGPRKYKILPGTQHNQQMRYKGLGMAHLGGNKNEKEQYGDHIITYEISIPKNLNEKQKQALENYAKVEDVVK